MNVSENLEEVTDLLLKTGKIDKYYTLGFFTTHLYEIVKKNDYSWVKYLLENKRDLSSNALACILWYAISHKFHEITKILVENGADVNQLGIRHHFYDPRISLLSWAVYCKNKHAVKLLIKHGANVNDFDSSGMGALYFAIVKKEEKIIRLLLDSGADINCKDDHGNSMFLIASETGVSSIINLIAKFSFNVNVKNIYGQNALHCAAQGYYDSKHIVLLLVKLGMSVDEKDNHQETPLHYALSLNKKRMAAALIDCDADVHALSKDKIFPLYLALAIDGTFDLAKKILYKGAHINQQIIDGESALHYACRNEDHGKIAFLLTYKADINIVNKAGQTPLSLIKNKKSLAAKLMAQHVAHLKRINSFILEQNLAFVQNHVDLQG